MNLDDLDSDFEERLGEAAIRKSERECPAQDSWGCFSVRARGRGRGVRIANDRGTADVLTLIGLEAPEMHRTTLSLSQLREASAERLRKLETSRRPKIVALDRNIEALDHALKLEAAERAILRLAAVATQSPLFGDLLRLCVLSHMDLLWAVSTATGLHQRDVVASCAPSAPLRRSGFLPGWENGGFAANHFELNCSVVNALSMPRFDEERFLRNLLRRSPVPLLALADYAHVRELPIARRYVEDAIKRGRRGVNILIRGRPGDGQD